MATYVHKNIHRDQRDIGKRTLLTSNHFDWAKLASSLFLFLAGLSGIRRCVTCMYAGLDRLSVNSA